MTRRRRTPTVVGAVVGAFVVLNVLTALVDRYTRDPGGPTSSSYATAPTGLAAYADLLARKGHPISQLRDDLATARLDPKSTLVLLDPQSVDVPAAVALRSFVEAGGRLVAGGAEDPFWLDVLLDEAPTWSPSGPTLARVAAPVAEVAAVSEVRAAGDGSWTTAGETLPVLSGPHETLAVVAVLGRGRIALLADASPLQNRLLGRADDAAFGLGVAGPRSRPVVFAESVHGYGRASGLGAIPVSWRWALGGLTLAALVLIWARGRRLGPPERAARDLPPPRRVYVDSLAAVLDRSRAPAQAVAPVQAAVRERIARAAGLPVADAATVRRVGLELGLDEEELGAVLGSPATEAEVVAAGRALARLGGINGGRRS
jgi:hypothetical protein